MEPIGIELQDPPPPPANISTFPDCLEEKIPASLYDEMWRFLKLKNLQLDPEFFYSSERKLPINILHTNFGTGKSILPYAGHQLITSYSNDNKCYEHAKTVTAKFFKSFFGDIADLFRYPGAGRQKKYDLVISIPDADNGNYHKLDGEKEFAKLSIYEYYSYRLQYLLKRGGYLCVILPQNEVRKITGKEIVYKKNNNPLYDYNCFVEALISRERINYSVLIFKKY